MKFMKKFIEKVLFLFTAGVLLTALVLGCASASDKSKKSNGTPLVLDSSIKTGILENGMTYYVQKNGEPKNRIVLRLVVRAGSCMEEEDQKGVAHFIEHLAFNGTEHFAKSAIVDYFEKIGMNFGADLNAYTSFEETVYKLEIPADDPAMLETALLILKDWASAITFPMEEIEKERGVVTEEWRLRQGLQGRLSDKEIPFLLADSKFENRLPIGDMNVIANISRERILDFYKKWYRPEIMSVVVVGDADEQVLENAVVNTMASIAPSKKKISVASGKVPASSEKEILIIKDPEQKYTVVNLLALQTDFKGISTEEEIKETYVMNIASSIANQRLSEITNTPDAPWLAAAVGEMSFTNLTHFYYLGIVPKTGIFTDSLKAFFDEFDRILTFGVTESELNRMKDAMISSVEMSYANKDKTSSDTRASDIISYDIYGKVPMSDDDAYAISLKCIPEITLDEVNEALRKAFPDRGSKFLAIANDGVEDIPSDEVIMDVWKNYTNRQISAYEDDVSDDTLMDRPEGKGKIVSCKEIPELDAKEYVFENGIKVITKKTDFEVDMVTVCITGNGGTTYISDEDYPSSKVAVNYAVMSGVNGMTYSQLIKKITAKQISLGIDIGGTREYFTGQCKADEVEIYLQLLSLFMTAPQFDKNVWSTVIQNEMETAKTHGAQPNDVFIDKIREILFNDSRHAPRDVNYVLKMTAEQAEKVYRERFSNPADFTYIFTGDFDEEALLEECAVYLGTMKTTSDREEVKYIYYDFPEGKVSETVKKGLDNQGRVYLSMGGVLPPSAGLEEGFYENVMMSELSALMDIRLREVIREDKSGSYGIYVNGNIDGYPERFYRIEVDFGCEPERAQELTDEVLKVFDSLKEDLVSADYIKKLQETYRRNHEISLRQNDWWIDKISSCLVYTYEPLWIVSDPEKVASWITPEALRDTARRYLNTENYVSVFLKPEN